MLPESKAGFWAPPSAVAVWATLSLFFHSTARAAPSTSSRPFPQPDPSPQSPLSVTSLCRVLACKVAAREPALAVDRHQPEMVGAEWVHYVKHALHPLASPSEESESTITLTTLGLDE